MSRLILGIPTMEVGRMRWAEEQALKHAAGQVLVVPYFNGVKMKDVDPVSPNWAGFIWSPSNVGVPWALHAIFRHVTDPVSFDPLPPAHPDDILLYIHDDVDILEQGWDTRLLDFFDLHPQAGLVGFGGALGLGDPDLYQKPYQLIQLARRNFISNMRDAEAHGQRCVWPTQVATVDGFSMACRISFLQKIGGFTWAPEWMVHHNYDNALACLAARHHWEVWMLPVLCHHHGGLTATRPAYLDGLAKDHGGDGEVHRLGHEWLYKEFRDVLPIRV